MCSQTGHRRGTSPGTGQRSIFPGDGDVPPASLPRQRLRFSALEVLKVCVDKPGGVERVAGALVESFAAFGDRGR